MGKGFCVLPTLSLYFPGKGPAVPVFILVDSSLYPNSTTYNTVLLNINVVTLPFLGATSIFGQSFCIYF